MEEDETFLEEGKSVFKSLSTLASSELDLFKNNKIFPNLGITWNNVKVFLLMKFMRNTDDEAISLINNPMFKYIEHVKNKLGTDYQMRHAIVQAGQDLFGSTIFPQTLASEDVDIVDDEADFNEGFGKKKKKEFQEAVVLKI